MCGVCKVGKSALYGYLLIVTLVFACSWPSAPLSDLPDQPNDPVGLDSLHLFVRDTMAIRVILDSNKLNTTPVAAVSGVNKRGRIDSLNLSYLNITNIPSVLDSITELKALYITRNPLSSLPLGIGKLLKLSSLVLSSNKLDSLPSDIGGCANLIYLNINSNVLSSLPGSFYSLSSLKRVEISNNKLTILSDSITNLPISIINVADNILCNLTPKVSGWLDSIDVNNTRWNTLQNCK